MNSSYFSACTVLVDLCICKLSPDLRGEKRQGGMERPEGLDVLLCHSLHLDHAPLNTVANQSKLE